MHQLGYKYQQFKSHFEIFFKNGDSIWERLDRSLANNEWLIKFGGSSVHHLNCSTSDYSPLWILPEILDPTIHEKPFWFEEIWLAEKGCIDTVKTKYDKHRIDNNAAGIVPKIKSYGLALKRGSSRNFGSI